jgi:hypothetical protein
MCLDMRQESTYKKCPSSLAMKPQDTTLSPFLLVLWENESVYVEEWGQNMK